MLETEAPLGEDVHGTHLRWGSERGGLRNLCLLGGWKERPLYPGWPKTFPVFVLKALNLRQTETVGRSGDGTR